MCSKITQEIEIVKKTFIKIYRLGSKILINKDRLEAMRVTTRPATCVRINELVNEESCTGTRAESPPPRAPSPTHSWR